MKKNSNTYIILYATVLVVVVAALLSVAAVSLKPMQQANIKIEKMTAILNSIGEGFDAATAPEGKSVYVNNEYEKFIVASYCVNAKGEKTAEGDAAFKALDNLSEAFALKEAMPVFEAKLSSGEILYVVPTYGKGLWGPVWAYVALKGDCNEIYGVVLDHKSETPGLGAEIASESFEDQFKGKEIFKNGVFASITLTKGVGSSEGNINAVDAVSGGTLTSNGVSDMFKACLGDYVPFFESITK